METTGLAHAVELARARGGAVQLCVLRHGEPVIDAAIGCPPDALFWILSAGKPFVALLVHQLAERGRLDLDDPVSAHWPEFGRHGKAGVTVRQVLQHRSGLSTARSLLGDALAMTDWPRSVRRLEQARLRWPPGQVPAYQVLSYGFILGELLRRITGTGVPDLLRAEFLRPLALHQTHLGLPDRLWPRRVPLRATGLSEQFAARQFNRRACRQAVIPAAGISTTARDLARFYQALLRGGELDGVRVLAPETVAAARRPSTQGELDRVIKEPVRWAQGFQLAAGTGDRRPMGRLSAPGTFGHNGSNCCIAWADPDRDLVFVHLTDRLAPRPQAARHHERVADAVLAACS
jgi:CubicO group peptidase (beta-lactamase class C family)